jgi:addiction module HigA family antidote
MRLPTHRAPTPPGEILLEEWLKPMKLTQLGLAQKMGVDIQLVNVIVNGRRSVTAKTALLFGQGAEDQPRVLAQRADSCGSLARSARAEGREARSTEGRVNLALGSPSLGTSHGWATRRSA